VLAGGEEKKKSFFTSEGKREGKGDISATKR